MVVAVGAVVRTDAAVVPGAEALSGALLLITQPTTTITIAKARQVSSTAAALLQAVIQVWSTSAGSPAMPCLSPKLPSGTSGLDGMFLTSGTSLPLDHAKLTDSVFAELGTATVSPAVSSARPTGSAMRSS